MWKEVVLAILSYCHRIRLQVLRKSTKSLSHTSHCLSQHLNPELIYRAAAFVTAVTFERMNFVFITLTMTES